MLQRAKFDLLFIKYCRYVFGLLTHMGKIPQTYKQCHIYKSIQKIIMHQGGDGAGGGYTCWLMSNAARKRPVESSCKPSSVPKTQSERLRTKKDNYKRQSNYIQYNILVITLLKINHRIL